MAFALKNTQTRTQTIPQQDRKVMNREHWYCEVKRAMLAEKSALFPYWIVLLFAATVPLWALSLYFIFEYSDQRHVQWNSADVPPCLLSVEKHNTIFHVFLGRLGNQLFQYASIVGIAQQSGATPCFDHNPLSEYFEHKEGMCVRPSRVGFEQQNEQKDYAIYKNFQVNRDTEISGFLQSHFYFPPDVLQHIQIKERFRSEARLILSHVLNATSNRPRVAIHIRKLHGTHELFHMNIFEASESEDDAYLRFPSPSFFAHAMARVRQAHPSAIFIVISDSPEWCTKQPYLQHADVHIVTQKNSPILDLALIAACDHVILTRGTFGWWGAFLGAGARGGLVLYNAGEFDMMHKINAGHVILADYYPAHWVAISIGTQLLTAPLWNTLP